MEKNSKQSESMSPSLSFFPLETAPDMPHSTPNQETLDAIAEGESIANDPSVPSFRNMESLIEALNEP